MIVCSCAIITDRDIECAVSEIMSAGPGLLPTPGVVFRHLNKKMNCCTCAPIAVATIYRAMDKLSDDTRVCPFTLADARAKLEDLELRRQRRRERAVAMQLREDADAPRVA